MPVRACDGCGVLYRVSNMRPKTCGAHACKLAKRRRMAAASAKVWRVRNPERDRAAQARYRAKRRAARLAEASWQFS